MERTAYALVVALVVGTVNTAAGQAPFSAAELETTLGPRLQAAESLLERHQRRRGRRGLIPIPVTVDVETARALHLARGLAALSLARLEVQPADANHALRTWDEHHAWIVEAPMTRPSSRLPLNDCTRREIEVLEDPNGLRLARGSALGDLDSRAELVVELVHRRLIADEAVRRRTAALSCEDLAAFPEAIHGAVPELAMYEEGDASSTWFHLAAGAMIDGRAGLERIRAWRREEPARVAGQVRAALEAGAPTTSIELGAGAIPPCGCAIEVDEDEAARWARLGVALVRRYHAYALRTTSAGLILRSEGDTDCDGQRETTTTAVSPGGSAVTPNTTGSPSAGDAP